MRSSEESLRVLAEHSMFCVKGFKVSLKNLKGSSCEDKVQNSYWMWKTLWPSPQLFGFTCLPDSSICSSLRTSCFLPELFIGLKLFSVCFTMPSHWLLSLSTSFWISCLVWCIFVRPVYHTLDSVLSALCLNTLLDTLGSLRYSNWEQLQIQYQSKVWTHL